MNNRQTSYAIGLNAEEHAANFLTQNGYIILEHRYKTQYGEIDLIAKKDNMLAFIEVKSRPTQTEALESITQRAKKRISNTASIYLANTRESYDITRFDVITVTPQSIDYLENAWQLDELY